MPVLHPHGKQRLARRVGDHRILRAQARLPPAGGCEGKLRPVISISIMIVNSIIIATIIIPVIIATVISVVLHLVWDTG